MKFQWWEPIIESEKPTIKACKLQGTKGLYINFLDNESKLIGSGLSQEAYNMKHNVKFWRIVCKDWLKDGRCDYTLKFAKEIELRLNLSWTHNDMETDLEALDLKIIPKTMKNSNEVQLIVRQMDFPTQT